MNIDELFESSIDDVGFQLAMVEEELLHRVALRVMKFRKSRGMSQATLAKKLGTQQPAIARIEAGEANLQLRTLAQLAFTLGRVPEDFVADRVLYQGGDAWGAPNLRLFKGGASTAGTFRPGDFALPETAGKAI